MNKTMPFLLLWALIFAVSNLHAQYTFDTLLVKKAGPGTMLYRLVNQEKPWSMDIMTVEIKNPYISFETSKAKDLLEGLEKTSSMAARNDKEGHHVIGAINADFFSGTGVPINMQVCNGEVVRVASSRSQVGFNLNKRLFMAIGASSGKIVCKQKELNLSAVNTTRNENTLALYNRYMGKNTKTNAYGTEISLTAISPWVINDTVFCIAGTKEENIGGMNIAVGTAVLSGHGTAAAFLNENVQSGDTVALIMTLSNSPEQVTQVLGAYPRMIKNGQNYVAQGYAEENGPSHTYERHPRSAIGISKDSSVLYLVTVDGRQPHSVGMTLDELANTMLQMGVYQAVNFDGGGSTTLVANGKIANSPSDVSGERNVANALLVVSSAPEASMNRIEINPGKLRIKFGTSQLLLAEGYNEYDIPKALEQQKIQWSCSANLGELSTDGTFKANGTESSGFIVAKYEAYTDSISVNIEPIGTMFLSPIEISTDSIQPVQYTLTTNSLNNVSQAVLPEVISWDVNNSTIGTVSNSGLFQGSTAGTTQVIASVAGSQVSSTVHVEIYRESLVIDNFDNAPSWQVYSEFLDSVKLTNVNSPRTEGESSLKIEYWFTYAGRMPLLQLTKTCEIKGIPDSVWLDAQFDGEIYRFRHQLASQNYSNIQEVSQQVNNATFEAIGSPVRVKALEEYPYEYRSLSIDFIKNNDWENNKQYTGILYLDNLRVSYPGHKTIKVSSKENHIVQDSKYCLYPNPTSGSINLEINVMEEKSLLKVDIYSTDGKLISTPLAGQLLHPGKQILNISFCNLDAGLYFIRLQQGQNTETLSLIKQ